MSFLTATLGLVGVFALLGMLGGWASARFRVTVLCHAAVFGSGAYAYAFGVQTSGSAPVGLIAAAAVGAGLGVAILAMSSRLQGERFALATFAVQMIWSSAVLNARSLTGGALGVGGVRGILTDVGASPELELILWVIVIMLAWFALLVFESRGLFPAASSVAARSEELALTLGVPAMRMRSKTGAVYGVFAGLLGAVFAGYLGFVGPTQFGGGLSVIILAISMIARDTMVGGVLGSAIMVGVPQAMRLVGVSAGTKGYLELLLGGVFVGVAACARGQREGGDGR